jgi:hypothetical protein
MVELLENKAAMLSRHCYLRQLAAVDSARIAVAGARSAVYRQAAERRQACGGRIRRRAMTWNSTPEIRAPD